MSAYLGEPAQPVPVPGPPAPSAWQGTSQGGICPSSGVPANSTNLTSLCRAGPSPEASSSLLAWGASLWLWQSLLSRAAPPCGCSGPCRVSHGVPLCGCGRPFPAAPPCGRSGPCRTPQHLAPTGFQEARARLALPPQAVPCPPSRLQAVPHPSSQACASQVAGAVPRAAWPPLAHGGVWTMSRGGRGRGALCSKAGQCEGPEPGVLLKPPDSTAGPQAGCASG